MKAEAFKYTSGRKNTRQAKLGYLLDLSHGHTMQNLLLLSFQSWLEKKASGDWRGHKKSPGPRFSPKCETSLKETSILKSMVRALLRCHCPLPLLKARNQWNQPRQNIFFVRARSRTPWRKVWVSYELFDLSPLFGQASLKPKPQT